MKQTDNKKSKSPTIRSKITACFLGMSVIILIVLWLTQTVFLDDVYRMITTARINADADKIAIKLKDDDVVSFMDKLHDENNMSIYVYKVDTSIFYQLYTSSNKTDWGIDLRPHELYKYYRFAKQNNGKLMIEENSDTNSEQNILIAPYSDTERQNMAYLTCVRLINTDGNQLMLVLKAEISPVESTVTTLRFLLIIITGLVILLSVLLAVIVSRNIARPLQNTTKKALRLGRQDYSVTFDSKGCREVEELNSTLNFASRELAVADGLRKELIANVSHDLRTPLTMITGYAQLMRDIPGENNAENLQAIIDESTRLTNLVNDLLDISKLQSGAVPIKKDVFSLTGCISDILTRFSLVCQQNGYAIDFVKTQEVFVLADEARISQVVYNLVSNAINYSTAQKNITVTQGITDGKVRIEIADSGEGIDPEKLRHIWDRYYRIDKTHARSIVGTGLGLSIVKEILDMHHARFGVISTPGKGSTFWFELPYTHCTPTDADILSLN